MKTLALVAIACAAGAAGLVKAGVLPCPCELVSSHFAADAYCDTPEARPTGLYLEVRDATVWGGACHIGSEAVSQGAHALQGWAFEAGESGGVDLAGVRVVAAIQGTANLQGREVFRSGEAAEIRSALWVAAPSAGARDAAVECIRSMTPLGRIVEVIDARVELQRDGDSFTMSVPGVLQVQGAALPDRSCCSMPESRWYSPLGTTSSSIVGNPGSCRFGGLDSDRGSLVRWVFEGENSAFIARFGA